MDGMNDYTVRKIRASSWEVCYPGELKAQYRWFPTKKAASKCADVKNRKTPARPRFTAGYKSAARQLERAAFFITGRDEESGWLCGCKMKSDGNITFAIRYQDELEALLDSEAS